MEPDPLRSHRRRYLPALWWCLVLCAGGGSGFVGAADDPAATKAVLSPRVWSAGFLLKVFPFVTWHEGSLPEGHVPITVGLLGHDPFEGHLAELLANTIISGHQLRVVVVTNRTDVARCQALFVPADEQALWRQWRQEPAAAKAPLLTIGDAPGFLASGGIIQLDPRERVFYLNVSHARTSQLHFTRLHQLARAVFTQAGAGPNGPKGGE